MYDSTDMRFASAYYHWFHPIQPSPLPETMIGGNPRFYLHWKLGGWGERRRPHRAGCAGRVRTLLLRAETIHAVCEDYRAAAGIDLEHDRASRAAGQKIGCDTLVLWGERGVVHSMFEPLALWQAQCSAGERPRASCRPLPFAEERPRKPPRRCSTSSLTPPTTPDEEGPPCSSGCSGSTSISPVRYSAPARLRRGHDAGGLPWVAFDRGGARAGCCSRSRCWVRDTRQTRHAVAAQPPGDRPPALPARVHPARDAAVLHRGRQRGRPFSRQQRSLVYQRAKGDSTSALRHADGRAPRSATKWINHSLQPSRLSSARLPRHHRRGPTATALRRERLQHLGDELRRAQANAVLALNEGGREGFAHDTGEGLDQPPPPRQRRRPDLGDRLGLLAAATATAASAKRFIENARLPQVKMVELKLSQGAKPGHGGVLPGPKVTPES